MSLFIEDTNPNNEIISILKEPSDPTDDQIAALQEDIENLKNKHQEDKFMWFVSGIALLDIVALLHVDNWTGPLVIGLIELIAIIVMANRCKVEVVAPLIDKIIGGIGSFNWKKSKEDED